MTRNSFLTGVAGLVLLLASPPLIAAVKIKSSLPSATATSEWKWFTNAEKIPEMFSLVQITFPSPPDFSKLALKRGSRVIEKKDNTLKLVLSGLSETVSGVEVNGQMHSIQIQIEGGGKQVSEWGCQKNDLELSPLGAAPPEAYIGMACKLGAAGEMLIWMTVPGESEWGTTTLFEDAGKGERWHQFTLQKFEASLAEKKLGQFNFSMLGKNFGFEILQKPNRKLVDEQNQNLEKAKKTETVEKENANLQKQREDLVQQKENLEKQKLKLQTENKKLYQHVKILAAQQPKPEEPFVRFRGGFGIAKIDMKTEDTTAGSMQPLLMFGITTKPIFLGLQLGGGVKFAVPLGTSSQTFYDIVFTVGPSIGSNSFKVEPIVGVLTMEQDYSPARVAFGFSSILLGTSFQIGVGSTSAIRLELTTSGMVPAGDSKHLSLGLNYLMKKQDRVFWSFGAFMQQTKFEKASSSFNQMLGAALLNF